VSQALAAALGYSLITALLFRNLLPVLTTDLYSDIGDPLLNCAVLAWNATHVPLTDGWWNFPSFAPLSGVTAFTEHLLGAYPVASPVIWTTGNPVLAYNVVLLLCFPLNGIATFALVRELTGSAIAAFVAGLAFAFAPFHAEHLSHVQTLMAFGMPLALFGLHRYLTSGKRADLAWFAFGWLSAILSNAYMLVFFPILVVLWMLWFFRTTEWRRFVSVGAVAILATAAVLPLLRGYYVRQTAYGFVRSYNEIKANSADIAALAGISHRALLWKDWLPGTYYETSLFPGFAIVALALIGVVAHVRRKRSASPSRSGAVIFYLVGAIVMWLFALGPEPLWSGVRSTLKYGPYWLLLRLPGAQSIRVPARAWLPATLCLAVVAGFGALCLASDERTKRVLGVLALIIIAEGWFYDGTMRTPERMLNGVIPDGAVVLDLPIGVESANTGAQYLAVLGGYRVVNGYSGYSPAHVTGLRDALANHRSAAFDGFRLLADLYVIVRPEVDKPFVDWLETQDGIERLPDTSSGKLYRLPRSSTDPRPPMPLPLPRVGRVAFAIQ
jgi:hypothetical protein